MLSTHKPRPRQEKGRKKLVPPKADVTGNKRLRSRLQKICSQHFGVQVSFEGVPISKKPEGDNWLLVPMISKLDFEASHDKLFGALGGIVLDRSFISEQHKSSGKTRAVWMRPSKGLQSMSANELKDDRYDLSLEEAIAFLVAYFHQHGKRFLPVGTAILCPSSTNSKGEVVLLWARGGTGKGDSDYSLWIQMVAPYAMQYRLLQPQKQ